MWEKSMSRALANGQKSAFLGGNPTAKPDQAWSFCLVFRLDSRLIS